MAQRSCQKLLFLAFCIVALLIGVRLCPALVCISPIINYVEHLFICELAMCISSLVRLV